MEDKQGYGVNTTTRSAGPEQSASEVTQQEHTLPEEAAPQPTVPGQAVPPESTASAFLAPEKVPPYDVSTEERMVIRGPAVALGIAGVLTVLVAASGGIISFVGPIFGYSGDGASSWYWSYSHVTLWLAPGAVALVAALFVLVLVGPTRRDGGRLGTVVAGSVIMLCGAWFVIGPSAWPVLQSTAGVFVPASPLRELAYQAGYSVGVGVILAALGGVILGLGLRGSRGTLARGNRAGYAESTVSAGTGVPAGTTA